MRLAARIVRENDAVFPLLPGWFPAFESAQSAAIFHFGRFMLETRCH
jgi:hypothetical protein